MKIFYEDRVVELRFNLHFTKLLYQFESLLRRVAIDRALRSYSDWPETVWRSLRPGWRRSHPAIESSLNKLSNWWTRRGRRFVDLPTCHRMLLSLERCKPTRKKISLTAYCIGHLHHKLSQKLCKKSVFSVFMSLLTNANATPAVFH